MLACSAKSAIPLRASALLMWLARRAVWLHAARWNTQGAPPSAGASDAVYGGGPAPSCAMRSAHVARHCDAQIALFFLSSSSSAYSFRLRTGAPFVAPRASPDKDIGGSCVLLYDSNVFAKSALYASTAKRTGAVLSRGSITRSLMSAAVASPCSATPQRTRLPSVATSSMLAPAGSSSNDSPRNSKRSLNGRFGIGMSSSCSPCACSIFLSMVVAPFGVSKNGGIFSPSSP
mmetsp:Transcript_3646/g.9251  ORF Transcript_3646/g.9251 Transcript_3646/m.9251 type:complete len:232 (+) Transcript_3646:197-892(+)